MKKKSVSRLGPTSEIMSVLKTGAFITFPRCCHACLIIGRNAVTDTQDIRVDYYAKGRQYFEHFSYDNSGLKEALAFIYALEEE